MEELELGDGSGGRDSQIVQELKEDDGRPFSSVQWDNRRYLGALLGKSVRAVSGAWEYTSAFDGGFDSGLGCRVKGLEPKEEDMD